MQWDSKAVGEMARISRPNPITAGEAHKFTSNIEAKLGSKFQPYLPGTERSRGAWWVKIGRKTGEQFRDRRRKTGVRGEGGRGGDGGGGDYQDTQPSEKGYRLPSVFSSQRQHDGPSTAPPPPPTLPPTPYPPTVIPREIKPPDGLAYT